MDKNFRIDIHRLEAFGENYSREVKTLLHKLQITSDLRRHCVYLKEFAKIFTLLPELWQYWNLIEKSLTCAEIDSLQNKHFRSTQKLPIGDKHFYVNCLYSLIIFPYHETSLQKFKRTKPLKEGLFYPHKDIDKLYHAYVRNSSSALSEKEFKEFKTALFLYNKLKDAGQNIDEWFKWLKETNDLE